MDQWAEAWKRWSLMGGQSEAEVDALLAAYRAGGLHAFYLKRLELLEARSRSGNLPDLATNMCDVYAVLEDRQETLYWLKKAADLREDAPLGMLTHQYDFLRDSPEFQALERRVGLLK